MFDAQGSSSASATHDGRASRDNVSASGGRIDPSRNRAVTWDASNPLKRRKKKCEPSLRVKTNTFSESSLPTNPLAPDSWWVVQAASPTTSGSLERRQRRSKSEDVCLLTDAFFADHALDPFQQPSRSYVDEEEEIEAQLQELGGRVVDSLLD